MAENNLFPSINPTIMEDVEIPLPLEVEKLSQVFKSELLKDIQHELVSPGRPNKSKVGSKIAELSFKTRQDLKKRGILQVTGRQLYVTGGVIRDWLTNHFHGIAHPPEDWNLATDASPDAFKLIIKAAIESGKLPPDTQLSMTDKKFGNLFISFGKKVFEITTFPFTGYSEAPRMYLDSLRRNFSTNALYYSVEDKKIFDFHSGITDVYRKSPNFIGKPKDKIQENGLYPLIYARLHSKLHSNGSEHIDNEIRQTTRTMKLSDNLPKDKIHDEFVKGIKTALNKEKYIEILRDLGLLRQIFPGLIVDDNPEIGEMNLLPTIVAQIVKPNSNNPEHVADVLRKLSFTSREINDIVFLLKLPRYFDETHLKSDRLHTGLSEKSLEQFIQVTNPRNSSWLLNTIKGKNQSPLKPQHENFIHLAQLALKKARN